MSRGARAGAAAGAAAWRLALVLAFALRLAGAACAETLVLAPVFDAQQLALDATFGGTTRRVATGLTRKAWRREIAAVYAGVKSDRYDAAALDPVLERLGGALYGGLSAELARADDVLFVLPGDALQQPLDLLHWNGGPLYLAKPVAYAVAGLRAPVDPPAASAPSAWTTALLVSDPTADPENAVGGCCRHWADVTYLKAAKLTPKKLKAARADVLLVSAHGSVKPGEPDSIAVGGEDVEGPAFAVVAPRLVYLDSCDLGVSASYLAAFRAAGTEYYLAPIVSNEAGDSSTATIQGFFAALRAGRAPAQALFETRRSLREQYRGAGKDLLWKCFPFRLYRLRER